MMSQPLDNESTRERPPERRLIAAAEREAAELEGMGPAGLPPPDSFAGYQIIREIHRGGQGVVYQAIQKSTHRKVALKVLKEGPFASLEEKARFEREVTILGQLNHPNIVNVHDSGQAAGCFYFVMDYISGQPLDVWLASGKRSIEETLRLFQKICEAVQAAHLKGIIHRDLKPGNIRIDDDGEPHILDFGLAKAAMGQMGEGSRPAVMTMTGQFMGSLPWASPEQAEALPGKVDIRTDVYSLGVILYQMLTGKFPYEVIGNMRDVLDRIMKAEPARPSTIRKQINDEVETIVLKCLSKERERRYQTAGELARDIGHYLKGEPIEARRDNVLYVLMKTLRRYRLAVALAAVFLAAGYGVGVVMSTMYYKERVATAQAKASAAANQLAAERERGRARRLDEKARALGTAEDVQDIPARECFIGEDHAQRYILIGPRPDAPSPPDGYRLVVALPGGDGSRDFEPFVRRVLKFATPPGYLLAEAVAPVWSEEQLDRVVWPTRTNPMPGMKFATEDFIEAIIDDVRARQHVDDRHVYIFGWSSGGPPCYAAALAERTSITGAFIAMSVFTPDLLPPLSNARGRSFVILHSADDDLVPPEQAQAAIDALRANGARVHLIESQGSHGWHENTYDNISAAFRWLDERLEARGPS